MGGLIAALKGAVGLSNQGQSDDANNTPQNNEKALECTENAWTDRKNAFIVYHQAIWECLLFYAGQMWI